MVGKEIRLGRLFQERNAFVVALDHGMVMGPLKGIEDPVEVVSKIAYRGPDALQMTPPMLRSVKENFMRRGSPAFIARLDTSNVWRHVWDQQMVAKEGYYSLSYSVKDAVKAGADAVVTYLVVGYDQDMGERENVSRLAQVRQEAEDFGIPFIVEPLFVSPGISDSDKTYNKVAYMARFASEIGADILKLDYTGDKSNFREIVKMSFAPILIRGGPKTAGHNGFIQMVKDAIEAGARGVTVGRNLWQSEDPGKTAEELARIIHGH